MSVSEAHGVQRQRLVTWNVTATLATFAASKAAAEAVRVGSIAPAQATTESGLAQADHEFLSGLAGELATWLVASTDREQWQSLSEAEARLGSVLASADDLFASSGGTITGASLASTPAGSGIPSGFGSVWMSGPYSGSSTFGGTWSGSPSLLTTPFTPSMLVAPYTPPADSSALPNSYIEHAGENSGMRGILFQGHAGYSAVSNALFLNRPYNAIYGDDDTHNPTPLARDLASTGAPTPLGTNHLQAGQTYNEANGKLPDEIEQARARLQAAIVELAPPEFTVDGKEVTLIQYDYITTWKRADGVVLWIFRSNGKWYSVPKGPDVLVTDRNGQTQLVHDLRGATEINAPEILLGYAFLEPGDQLISRRIVEGLPLPVMPVLDDVYSGTSLDEAALKQGGSSAKQAVIIMAITAVFGSLAKKFFKPPANAADGTANTGKALGSGNYRNVPSQSQGGEFLDDGLRMRDQPLKPPVPPIAPKSAPIPKHPIPAVPRSPTTPPGSGWTWRGKPGAPVGGDKGAWFNPKTGETLHPDLGHGGSIGPHWDWRDPDGNFWRLFPDGRIMPRK